MEVLIDALSVALLGVVAVFLVLSLIILLIKMQEKLFDTERKNNTKNDASSTNLTQVDTIAESKNQQLSEAITSNNHIVVITAAISAYLGSGVQIRSIRQIHEESPTKCWNFLSRAEQNR